MRALLVAEDAVPLAGGKTGDLGCGGGIIAIWGVKSNLTGGLVAYNSVVGVVDNGSVRHLLGNAGISYPFQAQDPDAPLGVTGYGGWGGQAGGGE